jgi:branched-chain amino acid transport system ATP-binding protein
MSKRNGETVLKTEDLTKEFGGLLALDKVSMEVESGKIVGLIGPNGAGKTTFFNCVSGVHTPTGGQVWFEGEEVTELGSQGIAQRGLTRTFQQSRPIEEVTVLENVMIGAHTREKRRKKAKNIATDWLRFVGLEDESSTKAGNLTLARQRTMELARALATEPKLILIDEIMAGLTPNEKEDILELFEQIRENGTSLMVIEHDMSAIMEISDQVLVLDGGAVLANGDPDDVRADERVIESYVGDRND